MKQTVKTSRTAGYLEKMFRALNQDFFFGELEEPIITIQSTPRAYGHVTVAKIWKRKGEARHELNIDAGTLERPIENLVATILHEMVHLYNLQRGVQDCSRGGTYHNRIFKEEAEKRALHIERDPTYGWTITEPTEELIEYIITQGWSEVEMSRGLSWSPAAGPGAKAGSGGKDGGDPKKSSTRKYICPCCGQSVRATKTVNILCGDCMETMELCE